MSCRRVQIANFTAIPMTQARAGFFSLSMTPDRRSSRVESTHLLTDRTETFRTDSSAPPFLLVISHTHLQSTAHAPNRCGVLDLRKSASLDFGQAS